MKSFFIMAFLVAAASNSAFACSCTSSEDFITEILSDMQGIDHRAITVNEMKESFNVLYALPNWVAGSMTRDPMRECELSCSFRGVKISAQVQYEKEGQVCEALLIKPARTSYKIKLKNIVCK